MEVKAKLSNLRIAPRKVRLIADLVRGKRAEEARTILSFSIKKASLPLRKLLDSAIANAKNNFNLDEKSLFISKITVDEGSKLKRWMPRSRGRAMEIQKKTSHISIILEGGKGSEKKSEEKKSEARKEPVESKKGALKEKMKKESKNIQLKKEKANFKRVFKRKSF